MGSGGETVEETVDHLTASGEKVGAVKVRLFRPFSLPHFLGVLPSTTKVLAVLDRTKEPGSIGDSDLTAILAHRSAGGHRHLGLTQLGDDLLRAVLLPRAFRPFHLGPRLTFDLDQFGGGQVRVRRLESHNLI